MKYDYSRNIWLYIISFNKTGSILNYWTLTILTKNSNLTGECSKYTVKIGASSGNR